MAQTQITQAALEVWTLIPNTAPPPTTGGELTKFRIGNTPAKRIRLNNIEIKRVQLGDIAL